MAILTRHTLYNTKLSFDDSSMKDLDAKMTQIASGKPPLFRTHISSYCWILQVDESCLSSTNP